MWQSPLLKYLIIIAVSGNSLVVVFILKSDNISQIPSPEVADIYTFCYDFSGIADIDFLLPKT